MQIVIRDKAENSISTSDSLKAAASSIRLPPMLAPPVMPRGSPTPSSTIIPSQTVAADTDWGFPGISSSVQPTPDVAAFDPFAISPTPAPTAHTQQGKLCMVCKLFACVLAASNSTQPPVTCETTGIGKGGGGGVLYRHHNEDVCSFRLIHICLSACNELSLDPLGCDVTLGPAS